MYVPACGWNARRRPAALVSSASVRRTSVSSAQAASDSCGVPSVPARPARASRSGDPSRAHAQDVAGAFDQQPQPLAADRERILSEAGGAGRQRGIDLGEPEVAPCQERTQFGALRQAVVELGALVPDARDLAEDRDRVGGRRASVGCGVMPQDRDRPDRGVGQRIAGAPESGAQVGRGRLVRLGRGHWSSVWWWPRSRCRHAIVPGAPLPPVLYSTSTPIAPTPMTRQAP